MEVLLFVLIVLMTLYFIGSRSDHRRPRHRFDQQHPNYSDDVDDFDDYQQQHYAQQHHSGRQPIIIISRGGYPNAQQYERRDEGSPLTGVLGAAAFVILLLIYFSDYLPTGKKKEQPDVSIEEKPQQKHNNPSPGQSTKGDEQPQTYIYGDGAIQHEREQEVSPIPTPPLPPRTKRISRPYLDEDFYVIYLGEYSSKEGVNTLKQIYDKRKIVGLKMGSAYWACILVNSEDAAWAEMERWNKYDNDYRQYGLEPGIRNLREYCGGLVWNLERDMLICE